MSKYYKKVVGERLFLSPMDEEDLPIYTKWLNDSSITDNLGMTWNLFTEEKEKKELQNMAKDGYNFAIVRLSDEKLLGSMSILDINHRNRNAQCGLFIGDEEDRSQGYGTEALNLLLSYAFNTLNINNMMLKVFSFNQRAIACYKKVGFREIGRRRKSYFVNGSYHDEIFMDILSNE